MAAFFFFSFFILINSSHLSRKKLAPDWEGYNIPNHETMEENIDVY